MRTFFAIDTYSSLRPSCIRRLVALCLKPEEFEVLPLEEERFFCSRNNLGALQKFALAEGRKVIDHYPDAIRCVVVFGYDASNTGRFDYATILDKKGGCLYRLLNPQVPGRTTHWTSSPGLQPELAEHLLDISGVTGTS